jgi:hypothetical protein
MTELAVPAEVNWDITYACPLRCVHCYSESGRRPTRQLDRADQLRVADAIITMRPGWVALSGGEPLVVPGVFDIAERFGRAGIPVSLYTSGWSLRPGMLDVIVRLFTRVNVSVDGANAGIHDRIRGRAGSFDRAMAALALLDGESARRVATGGTPVNFGIDCTVVRSGFDHLTDFVAEVVPRFAHLGFIWFAGAIPAGLASRPGFAEHELLTDEQADTLASPAFAARLRALTPPTVGLSIIDTRVMVLDPAVRGQAPYMQLEPDGGVRTFPIYEGTAGNLLDEPGSVIWQRCQRWWADPFVRETLSGVRTMRDWAAATRLIDHHFGTVADRARFTRRPDLAGPVTSSGRR